MQRQDVNMFACLYKLEARDKCWSRCEEHTGLACCCSCWWQQRFASSSRPRCRRSCWPSPRQVRACHSNLRLRIWIVRISSLEGVQHHSGVFWVLEAVHCFKALSLCLSIPFISWPFLQLHRHPGPGVRDAGASWRGGSNAACPGAVGPVGR